jgi:aubergine-like protein
MIAIPSDKGDTYGAVKKLLCCGEKPVPSQVLVLSRSLKKVQNFNSTATKVLIQMTSKMGGAPWKVSIPLQKTMVIGFDTYHDTANAGSSVGALVASLDKDYSRYYSATSTHASRQEMSNQIPTMVIGALRKYMDLNNGELPTRIFFYRDGVGEGQLQQIVDTEVSGVLERFKTDFGDMKPPRLTVIVVSKRIKTK